MGFLCVKYIRPATYLHNLHNTCCSVADVNQLGVDSPLSVQAGDVYIGSTQSTEQITTFIDDTASYTRVIASNPDSTFSTSDRAQDSLEGFFARPVRIASYSWYTGTVFRQDFNPWQLYFANPRVLNRISNYYLMRCKLHVKVVVNGSAFLAGRAIVSYRPYVGDATATRLRNRFGYHIDLIEVSQRPHIFINPTTSQGGDLVLPFFWHENYLEVTSSSWTKMGDMSINSINSLVHASHANGEDFCTVSVFAWAEDMELSVPTTINPDTLAPQAGEYSKMPVSQAATAVSRAAQQFEDLPVIGPYARATQMAADAVTTAATAFGMSRPPLIDPPQAVKITSCNMANTNVPENVHKIGLDVKQELTVDSRTVGLDGVDELSIAGIASREAYLTTFSWPLTATSESRLFSSVVDPMLFDYLPSAVGPCAEMHLTPMAFAALPFKYWRGTLKFRFQIVANGFHRGRLKVVYDPVGALATTTDYNTSHTTVVDIAQTQDFTIKVGWGSRTSYRPRWTWPSEGSSNPICPATLLWQNGVPMVAYAPSFGYGNGTLAVYVVNTLTGAVSGSPNDRIDINVFVSADKDFEVAEPFGVSFLNLEDYYTVQAGELVGTTDSMDEPGDNATTEMTILPAAPTDQTNLVFFGERIVSFRELMKRYSMYTTAYKTSNIASGMVSIVAPIYPSYKTLNKADLSYAARTTLVQYVASAFMAWRGSVRWKFNHTIGRDASIGLLPTTTLHRTGTGLDFLQLTAIDFGTGDTAVSKLMTRSLSSMQRGGAITLTKNEPVFEIEFPFYSTGRFAPLQTNHPGYSVRWGDSFVTNTVFNGAVNSSPAIVTAYLSVGEDFNVFFFINTPILFFQPS